MENKDTATEKHESVRKNDTCWSNPPEITSDLKIFSLKGKTAGGESIIVGSKWDDSNHCNWLHRHNVSRVKNEEDALKVAFEGEYIRMICEKSANYNA